VCESSSETRGGAQTYLLLRPEPNPGLGLCGRLCDRIVKVGTLNPELKNLEPCHTYPMQPLVPSRYTTSIMLAVIQIMAIAAPVHTASSDRQTCAHALLCFTRHPHPFLMRQRLCFPLQSDMSSSCMLIKHSVCIDTHTSLLHVRDTLGTGL
jgi:hypothetical protein